MHHFTADGEHLYLFDAFGLTEVTLPDKARTDKVRGTFLSVNGALLVAHIEAANKRFARKVPGLGPARLGDGYDISYRPVAVLPDGKRVVCYEGGGLQAYAASSGNAGARLELDRKRLKRLKPIDLGPLLSPVPDDEPMLAVGPDGSFAVLSPGSGELLGGNLGQRGLTLEGGWRVKTGAPQGRVSLQPGPDGTFVSAFHVALDRAFCALVRDGKVTTRVVDCVGPVAFADGELVYQTGDDEVVREPLDGDGRERFLLPEEARGVGEVLAHDETVLFLPPDRERLYDLTSGDTIDRKLPAKEREVRAEFIAIPRRFNALGKSANLTVELVSVNPPAWGVGHRPELRWDHGDLGILRLFVCGQLTEQMSSYSPPREIRAVNAEEMIRAFEVIDATELELLPGLRFLETPYEECYGGSFSSGEKVKVKPAMKREAEHLLLWAIIETLKSKRPPPLAKKARAWGKKELTPDLLIKQLNPASKLEAWFDAQVAAAWIVLNYFQAEALPIFVDWLVERPSGFVQANSHIMASPVARMMVQHRSTRALLLGAIKKARQWAKGEERKMFLENLESSLQSELS
jgi:hypothetical protein